jgi:hypothetical protein
MMIDLTNPDGPVIDLSARIRAERVARTRAAAAHPAAGIDWRDRAERARTLARDLMHLNPDGDPVSLAVYETAASIVEVLDGSR